MMPADRMARIQRTAQLAREVGQRETARRLGLNRSTVSTYVALAFGAVPSRLQLEIRAVSPGAELNGERFRVQATGFVRRRAGRRRRSVRFECEAGGKTLPEAIAHALAAVDRKAMELSQPPDRRAARRRDEVSAIAGGGSTP